jgi:hypothetical protein
LKGFTEGVVKMDWMMILAIAAVVIIGTLISAYIISMTVNSRMEDLYAVLLEKELKAETAEKKRPSSKQTPAQKPSEQAAAKKDNRMPYFNEEELLKKLKQAIDEKVQNVLEEAKRKKERLLMLLDVMRGYTLGYISEDEYNAFLMKILVELDEFKRLWLARFPSQRDKEKLNQAINYVSRTKLPIVVKSKSGKEQITLPPEEALIRVTSNINSAIEILDELIRSRGENPAVTPLEVKLQKECESLKAKVERLERQLEEYSALT